MHAPAVPPPIAALGLALVGGLIPRLGRRWEPAQITEDDAKKLITESQLACLFAKVVIDTALLGLFTMQLIAYAKYVRREPRWIVAVVVVASTLTYIISAYIIFYVHHLFVHSWGTYKHFLETNYYCMYPAFDAMASSTVQSFFTYRCYRLLGRNWWIVGVLFVFIAGGLTSACVVTGTFWNLDSMLDAGKVRVPVILWLSLTLTGDLIITFAIGYGLLKSRTGWAHTDKTVNRLVRINLEAQAPATIMACAFLVIFILMPTSLLNVVWQGIQSKFYVIGLLYTLNSRVQFEVRAISVFKPDQTLPPDLGGITVDVETETFEDVTARAMAGKRGDSIPLAALGAAGSGSAGGSKVASRTSLHSAKTQSIEHPPDGKKGSGGSGEMRKVSAADGDVSGVGEGGGREKSEAPTSPSAATDNTLVGEPIKVGEFGEVWRKPEGWD